MGKKKNLEYTTIQISKNINQYIKKLCQANGWTASYMTEQYWLGQISASMSGSISV